MVGPDGYLDCCSMGGLYAAICLIFKQNSQEVSNKEQIIRPLIRFGGTRWRSWLSHCATNRKVAGSIPDCVIRFFY